MTPGRSVRERHRAVPKNTDAVLLCLPRQFMVRRVVRRSQNGLVMPIRGPQSGQYRTGISRDRKERFSR